MKTKKSKTKNIKDKHVNDKKKKNKNKKKKNKKFIFDKKVALLVFYGRKKYAKILFRYIFRELRCNGGVVDKICIFKNTIVPEDLEFLNFLISSQYGKYIEILQNVPFGVSGYSTSFDIITKLYNNGWVFVKLDDDIIYVEKDGIRNLIYFTLKRDVVCSGNVINSSHGSYIHDRIGAKFTDGIKLHPNSDYAAGPMPSTDWNLKVHQNFIKLYNKKQINKYKFNIFYLEDIRWSINVVCWTPELFENFFLCRDAPGGDEVGISYNWPKIKNKNCAVYGGKLFVHWAFGFQRPVLSTKEGDELYDSYVEICKKNTEEYYKI